MPETLYAFYKDFGNMQWCVVIVGPDRGGERGVHEVIDVRFGSREECDFFAKSYLGPDTHEVYRAPN